MKLAKPTRQIGSKLLITSPSKYLTLKFLVLL